MTRTRGSGVVGFAATMAASAATGIVLALVFGGADDLAAFFVWSTPLALAVGILVRVMRPRRRFVQAAVGAACGVLWTLAVVVLLGGFFLLFSFPVGFGWIVSGAAGMVAGAMPRSRRVRVVEFTGTAAVLFLLFAAPPIAQHFLDRPDLVADLRDGTSDARANSLAVRLLDDYAVEGVGWDGEKELDVDLWSGATKADEERVRRRLARSPLVVEIGG